MTEDRMALLGTLRKATADGEVDNLPPISSTRPGPTSPEWLIGWQDRAVRPGSLRR